MSSPVVGIALLLSIVLMRWVSAQWKRRQFTLQFQRGSKAFSDDDMATAAEAFGKCARIFPTSAQVRLALGAALARRHQFKEAEEQLRLAAQLEPRQPRGHLELGYFFALCKPDCPDEAVAAFAEALTHGPELKAGLAKDPRLALLRQHAPFQDLVK